MLSKLDVALCGSNRLGPTEYMYRNVASRSYSEMSGIESPLGSAVPGVVSPETSVPPVVPAAGVVAADVAAAVVPAGRPSPTASSPWTRSTSRRRLPRTR